jgi:hypothetical protein
MDALSQARQQAADISPRELSLRANPIYQKWTKPLETERGDVPLPLAAVLTWSAGGGGVRHLWPVPPVTARRLGVVDGAPNRVQLWAGLRVVNEVAAVLQKTLPDLFKGPDGDFWACTVQARDIGVARWVEALKRSYSPESEAALAVQLASWALEAPREELSELRAPAAMLAYRLIAAPLRVQAAVLLGGGAPLVSEGFGKLIERPDIRLRINVARALGGTQIASLAAFGAWKAGKALAPKLVSAVAAAV